MNYCCNSAPSAPPGANKQSHNPFTYEADVKTYLDYFDPKNSALRDSHDEFCGSSELTCVSDSQMHLALEYCFISSETRVNEKSSVEKCQDINLS
jgi:hypothetical protein